MQRNENDEVLTSILDEMNKQLAQTIGLVCVMANNTELTQLDGAKVSHALWAIEEQLLNLQVNHHKIETLLSGNR